MHVARVRINLGIDRIHLAFERLPFVRVGLQRDLLPERDQRQLLLRNVEIHINRINRLQRDKLVARVEVLAGIHRRDAELAAKGRANRFLVDQRLLLRDQRPLVLEIGGVGIDLRFADRLGVELRLVPVVDGLRKVGGSFQRVQLRDVGIGVELRQYGACAHFVARAETDRADETGHLARHIDAAHGAWRPDGIERGLPFLKVHLRRGDGRGGRRLACHVLPHHVALEEVEPDDAAQEHPYADQHDDHAFRDRFLVRVARAAFEQFSQWIHLVPPETDASAADGCVHQPPPSAWNKAAVSA